MSIVLRRGVSLTITRGNLTFAIPYYLLPYEETPGR